MPTLYSAAKLMATAALDEVAEAAPPEPDAVEEADSDEPPLVALAVWDAPPPAAPPPEPEAVAEAEPEPAPDEVDDEPPFSELAFFAPHVTDWQAVMPARSFGWLSTQLAFHSWQMKNGIVCW